jgi:predicted GIY-YIG superfamily endonuclease
MYYVYVLRIKNIGRYYIGQTQDLTKRLEKHQRGETKSMKNRGEFEFLTLRDLDFIELLNLELFS